MNRPTKAEGIAWMIAKRLMGEKLDDTDTAYWCPECYRWWVHWNYNNKAPAVWTCKPCDDIYGQVRTTAYIEVLQ